MRPLSIALISVLALSSARAFAQKEDDSAKKKSDAPKASAEGAAKDGSETKTEYVIRRGFFAVGDLGVFVTLGGVNTNSVELNSRSTSNLQPYIGATFGYDVFSTSSFDLALGLRLAMGLNGGAGRADVTEGSAANTKSNDYSIQEIGAAIDLGFLVTERFGLTLKLHGGAGFVTPDPTLTADDPNAGKAVFAPVVGGQFGVELYTLLNDFSIGIQAGFVGAIVNGEFIPGLSGTIPIKYTF